MTVGMCIKSGTIWSYGFGESERTNKQTEKQTDMQTDKQTRR